MLMFVGFSETGRIDHVTTTEKTFSGCMHVRAAGCIVVASQRPFLFPVDEGFNGRFTRSHINVDWEQHLGCIHS